MDTASLLNTFILIWVALVGLCIGSFLNVVILRSLSGESIVFPPSKCPKCNNKLKPWHNIPVLSYITLRGKCAYCKEKISLQYPLIEIITMALFVLSYLKFGLSITTLFVVVWLSCLVVMTGTDLKEKLADCNIAIFMAITGLIYSFIGSGLKGLLYSALGLITGALIIEIIARLGYLTAKKRAMGEADTYVAGALGAICGFPMIINVLIYGLIGSMILILPLFWYNCYKRAEKFVLIMSVLFIISILVFTKISQNYFTLGFLTVSGLILAGAVIRSMKNAEKMTYLPYIPALFAGFLFFLFFVI